MLANVEPVIPTGGLTLEKLRSMAVGFLRSEITLEVNEIDSGGADVLSVRPVPPLAPNTASVNVPLKKFVPPPPVAEVIEKEPLNS